MAQAAALTSGEIDSEKLRTATTQKPPLKYFKKIQNHHRLKIALNSAL
jgi:hypothetical protein